MKEKPFTNLMSQISPAHVKINWRMPIFAPFDISFLEEGSPALDDMSSKRPSRLKRTNAQTRSRIDITPH
ncbi:hypothetical protein NL501_28415, partial [Klebsiella pneumoniae]|nr:hypothetical protein [Klebsiella pneumoniae]